MPKVIRRELSFFDPKMNREEFYEEFGIDYSEWHSHAEEMFEIESSLGYGKSMTNINEIMSSALSPFNIYFINQSLKSVGDGTMTIKDIFRPANSFGLRSDEFKKDHEGLHILFAGCSITFGDGVPDNYVWAKRVYDEIAKTEKVSGFYNVAINGGNHVDIFSQIYNYIKEFSQPDVIFINFPDLRRLADYGIAKEIMSLIVVMYGMLEKFCEAAGTRLISFSWDAEINLNPDTESLRNRLFFDTPDPRNSFGTTFHKFDVPEREKFMFEYSQNNKSSIYKDFFVRGLDVVHPGIAEHEFYTKLALGLYCK